MPVRGRVVIGEGERDEAPMLWIGEEVGRFFHDLLQSKGIQLIGGDELRAFIGDERVRAVRTKAGREVEGDCVVVGAGVHPETMLAEKAGLERTHLYRKLKALGLPVGRREES